MKLYHIDGSTKEYKLNEIDSLSVIDKKNNYVLRIHYDDSLIAYYPTEIIGSIKFENDSLNVYIFSYPKPYKLSSIDSLIFYIDQWQPLTIGSQVWMLKNLNVDHYRNGDSIPNAKSDSDFVRSGFGSGSWCNYNNSDSLGKIYGKLYNWYAVNDSRGLAPASWHVPNYNEFRKLLDFLGGDSLAGGKMKENGIDHWISPNTFASNESGFSAIPSGFRYGSEYTVVGFENIGTIAALWVLEVWYFGYPMRYYLYPDEERAFCSYDLFSTAMSVRCVKDK